MNPVCDALGTGLRDLPFAPERVRRVGSRRVSGLHLHVVGLGGIEPAEAFELAGCTVLRIAGAA